MFVLLEPAVGKVVWRSTCRESGAQCVAMALVVLRLMLPAGNWDMLLPVVLAMLVSLGKKLEIPYLQHPIPFCH